MVVVDEAGQPGYGLRGEVPDCMENVCGMDSVMIYSCTGRGERRMSDVVHQGALMHCLWLFLVFRFIDINV